MDPLERSPLGRTVAYDGRYDPSRLFAIPRALGRAGLGVPDPAPFFGVDVWNAYELSWLDKRGKPRAMLAEFRIPASSPKLIESKSLKLYLNGFVQTRFDSAEAVRALLRRDLSEATGAPVVVMLAPLASPEAARIGPLAGDCIDELALDIDHYGPPRPEFLQADPELKVEETLVSHLLKSNCPVTGQPDWASVRIGYTGPRIDHAGLLRYLVSFREHAEFHEHCVERIFLDLRHRCGPTRLSVYARYTRRGGLDINPWRGSAGESEPDNARTVRQ